MKKAERRGRSTGKIVKRSRQPEPASVKQEKEVEERRANEERKEKGDIILREAQRKEFIRKQISLGLNTCLKIPMNFLLQY